MKKTLLEKVTHLLYPERNITIEKCGKKYVSVVHDRIGGNDYLLEGTYTYDEVVKLNKLTKFNASFGYCKEIGPVAFIGIPNQNCVQKSGYFKYKVSAYATSYDDSEYYFEAYTSSQAKSINNYTVYGFGLNRLKEIARAARISKLCYIVDNRYISKKIDMPTVINMDCKLQGTYSYKEAMLLAMGTTKEKKYFSFGKHPIVFATLKDGRNIGIIDFWPSDIDYVIGFRDVFEYGSCEPKEQDIYFLSGKVASKIKDFELYIYRYDNPKSYKGNYKIEKYDTTIDKRFDFHLSNGRDYRLWTK